MITLLQVCTLKKLLKTISIVLRFKTALKAVLLFRKISNNQNRFLFKLQTECLFKVQLISLFFEDMQDNVEEVLELLHTLLGELQYSLLKNYINPAAKITGAALFEILLLQRGGVVSGHKKKLKQLQKMWEQEQFGNSWEVEKGNPSVVPDPFLEKVDRKPVASAKTFSTI